MKTYHLVSIMYPAYTPKFRNIICRIPSNSFQTGCRQECRCRGRGLGGERPNFISRCLAIIKIKQRGNLSQESGGLQELNYGHFIFWALQYWESMIRQSMHNKYYFMGVFNVLMCSTNECGCGVSLHFITCCYIYFLWGSHLQRQNGRSSSLGREKLSQPSLCRCCWNVYFMRQHSVRTNFNGCCNTSYISSV